MAGDTDLLLQALATKRKERTCVCWRILKTHRTWWSTIWLRLPHPVREFGAAVAPAPDNDETEVPFSGNQA
jgi:hypothetical protein